MLKIAAVLLPLFFLIPLQFDKFIRKYIFKRDRARCTMCGRKWDDGWMLECSHIDHNHKARHYNDPSNGFLACIPCHASFHEQLARKCAHIGDKKGERENRQVARLIRLRSERRRGF